MEVIDEEEVEVGTLAQALFDFDGSREDMLPFKEGDIITIIEMNDSGWWKGTNLSFLYSNGAAKTEPNVSPRVGIFPYSYVKVKTTSQESFPIAKALYSYKSDGADPDMLNFEAGDHITILREINNDWMYGKITKSKPPKMGKFPLKYVEMTGDYDEDTFKEESKKWEEIERKKREEMEKLKREKEILKMKLQQQELERLKEENRKKEEELEKQKKQLADLKRKQEQETLKRELIDIKRRAELAEKELEQAKAEAAILRKFQENKDARKSVMVKQKIDLEQERLKMKVERSQNKNNGFAPGPPPLIKRDTLVEFDNFETGELFKEAEEKEKKLQPRHKEKLTQIYRPVYVNQSKKDLPKVTVEKPKNVSELAENKEEKVIMSFSNELAEIQNPKNNTTDEYVDTKVEENNDAEEVEESRWAKKKKDVSKVQNKFANLGRGPECKKCGKSVGIANRVKACNAVWHDSCFRCSTCDKIIRNGEYVDRSDNPYCLMCHKKGFGPKGFGFGGMGLMYDDTVKTVDATSKKEQGKVEDKKAEVVTESWI